MLEGSQSQPFNRGVMWCTLTSFLMYNDSPYTQPSQILLKYMCSMKKTDRIRPTNLTKYYYSFKPNQLVTQFMVKIVGVLKGVTYPLTQHSVAHNIHHHALKQHERSLSLQELFLHQSLYTPVLPKQLRWKLYYFIKNIIYQKRPFQFH